MLAALVAALAINEFVHIVFEIWGLRQKVAWLTARMDKRPHGDWPININSLTKTILLHACLFCLFVITAFLGFSFMDLSSHAMLQISIIVLLITYAYTIFGMDAFHGDVGKLIKRYKRQ